MFKSLGEICKCTKVQTPTHSFTDCKIVTIFLKMVTCFGKCRSQITSPCVGQVVIIDCNKCTSCGWSLVS